jgi:hypothetical protein
MCFMLVQLQRKSGGSIRNQTLVILSVATHLTGRAVRFNDLTIQLQNTVTRYQDE